MRKVDQRLKVEKEFHDRWAKDINLEDLAIIEAFEGPVSPEYHFAINLLQPLNRQKILNPGCGAGEESVYLSQKGARVWAVDLSPGMLKVGERLAQKMHLAGKVNFQQMNVEKLTFPAKEFDLIFGNSILHHVDIENAAQEFSRVIKDGGRAVFIEPLAYNPLINYYRRLAKGVRTDYEHPLHFSDVEIFKKYFSKVNHYEFQLWTLLIFVYFYLVERVHPNKDRYWKKIIREGTHYAQAFKILFFLDKIFLTLFPFLKRFCWVTVVEAIKEDVF